MQFKLLKANGRNLARGCAILAIAGAAAGCSSQATRFTDGLDGISTSSTANQRTIIDGQASQPYPGDVSAAPASAGTYGGSIGRSSLEPVTAQALPPPAQPQARSVPAAPQIASSAVQPAVQSQLGQPPRSLNEAAREVKRHEKKVADARTSSATGEGDRVPKPARTSGKRVAVLPQQPKVKDGRGSDVAASDPYLKPNEGKATAAAAERRVDAPGTYTVRQGDTLSAISRRTGVSVVALKQANGMKDGLLRVGQTLKIPPAGEARAVASTEPAAPRKPTAVDPVKTASTPKQEGKDATPAQKLASYTPPKQEKVIEQAENRNVDVPDTTGIGKMRWPVRGRVITAFGSPGTDGINISVPKGTPIKAAENGVVIYAGNGLKEFGNTVLVRHENGLVTVYGYASELDVKRGQTVKRGEQIALSGMSGNAESPILHFEVRKNSAPVNPAGYLE
jgi:murein DD-endopeptidase MepM/ murein hydrolase activator NlpD